MILCKRFYVIPGALGVLAVFAGWLLSPDTRKNHEEMRLALSKLATIPLQSIRNSGSSTLPINIPNGGLWPRIRDNWGAPRYVIAIDSGPLTPDVAICFDEAGIKVELFKRE